MTFLRNVWYVAGWADEVPAGTLLARTITDEPVVIFRDAAGQPHALFDRCPHRFAPLSMGKLCNGGQTVQCGYHGLQFDGDGKCAHNPHGDGRIPTAAKVKAYPVIERWSLLWIWMGEPALAHPDLIPEFPFLDPEQWAIGKDSMEINANYALESDNILDLSHIEYLHPGSLGAGVAGEGKTTVTEEGDTVWSRRFIRNEILPSYLYQSTGLPEGAACDRGLDVRWNAPSLMYLQADIGLAGNDRAQSMKTPMAHLFTPATADRTHYFYSMSFPKAMGPQAQEFALRNIAGLRAPFVAEDKPMVEAQQRAIGDRSFWDMKPVLLEVDAPAVRARRVLDRLLQQERVAADRASAAR